MMNKKKVEGQESDDDVGGLNINQAKERMKERDKIDKELQRQRIKEQHREQRLKLKQKRRLAEMEKRGQSGPENEVVLGTADESVEIDDEKVNEQSDNDKSESDEECSDDSRSDDTEEDEPQPKKRKVAANVSHQKEIEEDSSDDDAAADQSLDEDQASDNESDIGAEEIEQKEAAVLALLGGTR